MQYPATPRWTARGLIQAAPEQAWQALLDANPSLSPAERQKIAREDDPQRFTVTAGYARIHLEVDKQHRHLSQEGEWWYRGVQSIEPDARGSVLVYQVVNIAPPASRWLVPLVVRGIEPQMRRQFEQLLQAIGNRLNCATTVLTS